MKYKKYRDCCGGGMQVLDFESLLFRFHLVGFPKYAKFSLGLDKILNFYFHWRLPYQQFNIGLNIWRIQIDLEISNWLSSEIIFKIEAPKIGGKNVSSR